MRQIAAQAETDGRGGGGRGKFAGGNKAAVTRMTTYAREAWERSMRFTMQKFSWFTSQQETAQEKEGRVRRVAIASLVLGLFSLQVCSTVVRPRLFACLNCLPVSTTVCLSQLLFACLNCLPVSTTVCPQLLFALNN